MKFAENLPISLHLSNLKLIEENSSKKYKKIQIFHHKELGKVFILDGEIQHIEEWTPFYHETIVHLASAFKKSVVRVLILGGGDFFTAREVLKYESVKEVIMIEHDPEVIEIISRNYKHTVKILNDKRFKLEINDAFKGLNELKGKFDLIINDAVDLINYQKKLQCDLFKLLSFFTKPDGICCDLIYRHVFEKATTKETIKRFRNNKLKAVYSLICVPEYPGILHLLVIWGHNKRIRQNLTSAVNEIQKEWIRNPKKIHANITMPRS